MSSIKICRLSAASDIFCVYLSFFFAATLAFGVIAVILGCLWIFYKSNVDCKMSLTFLFFFLPKIKLVFYEILKK